jgi:hypothetical protein
MQAHVTQLLNAATDTGRFSLVTDTVFDESDDYPALVVTGRRAPSRPASECAELYSQVWRYQVHVLVRKAEGWEMVTELVAAFLGSLFRERGWRLNEEEHSEIMVAEDDILAASLEIERRATERLFPYIPPPEADPIEEPVL